MNITSKKISSPNMFNTASPKSLLCGSGPNSGNPFCSDRLVALKFSTKESRIPDNAPSASPISNLTKDINSSLHLESSPSSPDHHAPLLRMLDQSLGSHTPRLFKRKYDFDLSVEDVSPGMMLQANNSPSAMISSQRSANSRPIRNASGLTKSSGLAQPEDMFMGGYSSFGAGSNSIADDENTSFDENDSFTWYRSSDSARSHHHRRQHSLTLTLDSDDSTSRVSSFEKNAYPQMLDFNSTPTAPMKRARSQSSAFLPIEHAPKPIVASVTMPIPSVSNPPTQISACPIGSPRSPECGVLPCHSATTDSIKRIDASTLADMLSGKYQDKYDEHIVIDCRFPYEYQGGHIKGAANAPTIEALEKLLLERPICDKKLVIVLHCEYSIQRAPTMASHLRRCDRELNTHRYPQLHYPEVYVLKGGYRNFFTTRKDLCYPQNYVEMNDSAFTEDCRQRMANFNKQFKRAKSVNDASIRSFGCSPVAMGRNGSSFAARPASKLARTKSVRPTKIPQLAFPPPSFGAMGNSTSGRTFGANRQSSRPSSFRMFP
ncbi:m-phase inducer phosphatase [Mycoemilia scoparia]|uniref:M-phase inducer phosphatase n=1 Tax=Mycoemilia scoparia TaxID=417184 RepID=A0A9W8DUW4_9FUNG|nr:m-phase inducer phosphatase [Mycoemilia scoparia]